VAAQAPQARYNQTKILILKTIEIASDIENQFKRFKIFYKL